MKAKTKKKLEETPRREKTGPMIVINPQVSVNPEMKGMITFLVVGTHEAALGFQTKMEILSSIHCSVTSGFIHLHPIEQQLDEIIGRLTEVRGLM